MAQDNSDQIAYWNGPVGETWAQRQAQMDAAMADISSRLIEAVDPQVGDRIVDIGCGSGATTLAYAEAAGETGAVLGVDVSKPLIRLAKDRAADAGLLARFIVSDAATHPFETRSYDLIASRFGVMFFVDPIAAFTNFQTALKPDGRLVFVCWRSVAENPFAKIPLMAGRAAAPQVEGPKPRAPGPFAFAEQDYLAEVLRQAGFDASIARLDATFTIGPTANAAAQQMVEGGFAARFAAELDDAGVVALRQVIEAEYVRFETSKGVVCPAACWLVTARPV